MSRAMLVCAALLLASSGLAMARGPAFDYACMIDCMDKDGWKPICVDNNKLPETGTLFPNTCALVCTTGTDETTPHYSYLPFNDEICSSAVGCSLLGKAADRCKALYDAGDDAMPSPKVSEDCDCELLPDRMGGDGGPTPAPALAPEPAMM